MVFINEWLPNPTGNDAKGEFIELYNDGSELVNLNNWILKTENGKKISLAGHSISVDGYLVLRRGATKFTLRNNDGELSLYDARGALVDQESFAGSAPGGKSFSRIDHGAAQMGQHFAFVDPTLGTLNKTINNTIQTHEYPFGVALNPPLGMAQFSGLMASSAVLLVGLIIYSIKTNEDLSKFFFKRDNETR